MSVSQKSTKKSIKNDVVCKMDYEIHQSSIKQPFLMTKSVHDWLLSHVITMLNQNT